VRAATRTSSASSASSSPPTTDATTGKETLFAADWYSKGAQLYGQQHPTEPLRLARAATMHATDPKSLDRAWAFREASGLNVPDGPRSTEPLVALASAAIPLLAIPKHINVTAERRAL